ncbi:MAG: hypothetical protein ACSLFK_09505 [Gemmatimonadaceae bacterium]
MAAAELHTVSLEPAASDCLDDDAIAALAAGDNSVADSDSMAHAAECANCRARVAAVARLMDDATITSEISALDAPGPFRMSRWSRRQLTVSGGLLAAAAAAIILLGPERSGTNPAGATHRDPAITATSAPRILSPIDVAEIADSLRWTRTPQADLYRVRIWNHEGTVVWTADTRDTTLTLPQIIQPGTSYLWEVSARTGWDRWVSSEFVELRVGAQPTR